MALARPWALIALLSPEQACRPTALALGSFDGVHAGHRHVIARAVAMAAGPPALVPTVLSFWPHPREVLAGEPRSAAGFAGRKAQRAGALGIEQLVLVPFDLQLAALSPEQFVQQVLRDQLQAGAVVIGENFRFGNRRSGGRRTCSAWAPPAAWRWRCCRCWMKAAAATAAAASARP